MYVAAVPAAAGAEFEHGAGAQLQQLADVHLGASQHGRDLHRYVEHRLEVGAGDQAVRGGPVEREHAHAAVHGGQHVAFGVQGREQLRHGDGPPKRRRLSVERSRHMGVELARGSP